MLYLIALTLGTFGIGTGEYVIMGLLPDIAAELHVSIPHAGALVSAYAMGVVIGAPVLALATALAPRKPTLAGLMLLFIGGNAACALAPGYGFLLGARIATALCHGTFFGIASVVAADLAEPDRRAQAIAIVFMGITLANMLGVPLGTAIGQHFGWRMTFWVIAAIGGCAFLALIFGLPGNIPLSAKSPAQELRVIKQGGVLAGLFLSVLTSASLFCVFTYITPLLQAETHVSPHGVTVILLIFGVGLTLGSVIGGKLGDGHLVRSLAVLMILTIGVLVGLRFGIVSLIPAVTILFLWSMCVFAINPMLQILVVNEASAAPDLASTFNQSAFNLGNATGAWLGGVLIARHVALRDLPLAAAVIMAAALVLVLLLRGRLAPGAEGAAPSARS